MAIHPLSVAPGHQRELTVLVRFGATTLGEFLKQARDTATVTQERLVAAANEIITKHNEHLPQKNKVQMLNRRIYGKLERNERYPDFEELEPLYQALFQLLEEPFSEPEREHYLAIAQARIGTRKKAPKKGYTPTDQDWQNLRRKLIAFDERHASGYSRGKTPYLLPVPPTDIPQIQLSAKVVSLLNLNTSSIIERDSYVDQMAQLWEAGKRLVVTKALSGTGKTRAFYLFLKRIARMPNYWPFYYILKPLSSDQTPDDHLDTLLSSFSTDLHLSLPEDEYITREGRMERIFTELTRCSEQGLRLAVLVDDAHLLLDPSTGTLSESWQSFFDLWIGREHTALLCLATREWPHWRGRDHTFLKEIELSPLSPEGGATLWKRAGFGDVADSLLEEAARKCGGYPQWIELRASDLDEPGHLFLWPERGKGTFTSDNADNQHTRRIKAWLRQETVFDAIIDVNAREELTQIFSRQLLYHAQQLLDLLAVSSLGIPFQLLEHKVDHLAQAIDELRRCSLIDSSMLSQGRAALVSLAREARLHQLSKEQREQTEERMTDLYACWLYELQQYQDDAEQAALIAELVTLHIKQQQFLKAGELLVTYGWLCTQLGYMSRIERYASTVRLLSTSSFEEEDGRALLYYQIMVLTGKKADAQARQARQAAYRKLHLAAQQGTLRLQPHTEIYITHEMLMSEMQAARYEQGQTLLDEALVRIAQSHQISAEVRALWNQSKARLLARWGEEEERRENHEKALALREESMQIMNETIALWEECLSSALPLNTKRLELKLGRAYNDYAYRLRLSGNINEAYYAIQKCLEFKQEKNAALPRSLAVAIGEHALILAARGQLLQADEENAKALSIQQDLLQKGDGTVSTDIGMLLIERGTIFMHQARIVEARPLFTEGICLIGESNSRRKYRDEAEKQIRIIDTSPHYYLDARWAERYFQLARYDDTEWLSSAGPFSEEEEQEWETLHAGKQEGEAKARMETIILQSRQRELEQCFVDQREPCLHYPTIPITTVEEHIAGFEHLLDEITSQEQNIIVRRLYQKSIQEQLSYLHMYKAIIQKECDRVWHYNQHLFGIPSREEVEIALLPLVRMLVGAQAHPEVGMIATNLLTQIKTWNIHQDIFTSEDNQKREQNAPKEKSLAVKQFDKKKVTSEIAKCFFEDILYSFYHFRDWEVRISPTRTMAHVEPSLRRVILPQKEYSIGKLRELLAEEIETHVFRAEAGYASPLMLLGSGTARYKYTEEALATLAKGEQANPKKSWLGTLAAGLMAGVVNPPFTFSALVLFLKQAFLVRNIKYEPYKEAEEAAQEEALERAVRAVRGIPNLTQPGICCLLDRIYLKGYLDLSDFLKKGGDIQRLFVGKIGTDDLPDMEQIHLLKPTIQQKHLAEQLDISTHIRKIEERSIAENQADSV